MKINNKIIDECISMEMKWFQDNEGEVKDRWFGWSDVFEGVMEFEFKKGLYYIWCCFGSMGRVEEWDKGDIVVDVKMYEEEFGKRFYEDERMVLVSGEDGVLVWVK
jgi:hypothetical protein